MSAFGLVNSMPSAIGTIGDPMGEGEIAFWTRQLSEHALFLHLGLEVEPLKRDAGLIHRDWERARADPRMDDILALARQLRVFKCEVLGRQLKGEWVGWIFPLFTQHLVRELDLFVAEVTTGLTPSDELCSWLRFLSEHASLAAHYMDPTEGNKVRRAVEISLGIGQMVPNCRASDGQFIALSERAGQQLDTFMTNEVPTARGVIHPVLQTHIIREGRRALAVMQRIRAREPAKL